MEKNIISNIIKKLKKLLFLLYKNKFEYYKKCTILLLYIFILCNLKYKIKKKNLKVCICVIGKKENLYASEFVNHYKILGYDHIFIYDNNDINDERFEDVILSHISSGFVSIINFRGFRGKNDKPQFDAFYDCYEKNNKKYNWISFFDFDEFLELNIKKKNIKDFLGNHIFKKCANIKINWLMYSDNDQIYYKNKTLKERFTKPILNDSLNQIIKSTVRGNLKLNYWKNMGNPHSSNNNRISCSSSGKIIDSKKVVNSPPDFKYALLKHYSTKTIEEYCLKLLRGRSDTQLKLDKKTLIDSFNYFFHRNKKTKEKLNYISKIFNLEMQLLF